jgi:hypothetical protein
VLKDNLPNKVHVEQVSLQRNKLSEKGQTQITSFSESKGNRLDQLHDPPYKSELTNRVYVPTSVMKNLAVKSNKPK